jgi:hypothetical protein
MLAQTRRTTYERAVQITGMYLGPAARRFIDRQVRSHLHKEPEDMTKEDLLCLIDWMQRAMSLLTDDSQIVDEYIQQLKRSH